MRRSVLLSVIVLAVVLAGCNGLVPGDATPTATVTPAAVPTDRPTATPVPQLAPGLTRRGVTDAVALGTAHAAALENTPFRLNTSFSVVFSNGTTFQRVGTSARFGADERYRFATHRGTAGERSERTYWSDGDRVLRTRSVNGTRSYGVVPNPVGNYEETRQTLGFDPTLRSEIYRLFGGVATRVVGRTNASDSTAYRVVGTRFTDTDAFEPAWRNPRDPTFRAVIDSRGVVRSHRLRYTATLDGDVVRVHQSARYSDLGNTTVERPAWYGKAVANATTTT